MVGGGGMSYFRPFRHFKSKFILALLTIKIASKKQEIKKNKMYFFFYALILTPLFGNF
jgi:hypothetical protein